MRMTSKELTKAIENGTTTLAEDLRLFSYYPADQRDDQAIDSNGEHWHRYHKEWQKLHTDERIVLNDPDPIVLPIAVLFPDDSSRVVLLTDGDTYLSIFPCPTIYSLYEAPHGDHINCIKCGKDISQLSAYYDEINEAPSVLCETCIDIVEFRVAVDRYVATLCA